MQVTIDVLTIIKYNNNEPTKTCIYTNARLEALEEVISNWLMDQVGRSDVLSQPVERSEYTIRIGLALQDDVFCTESDTGSKGLTVGIVMYVLTRLKDIAVRPLEELE
jgi:hypothetical protein